MASAGGAVDPIQDQARQEQAVARSQPGRGHQGGHCARGALVVRLQRAGGAGDIDAAELHLVELARWPAPAAPWWIVFCCNA